MESALWNIGRKTHMKIRIVNKIIALLRKMLNFYSNMRIAWKFTCAYFIILALPIIGTGIFINYSTIKSFTHQSELLAKQSLLQKREVINQKIESIEKTSISISQNPQILKYLEDPFENNYQGYENYFYFFSPSLKATLSKTNIFSVQCYISITLHFHIPGTIFTT